MPTDGRGAAWGPVDAGLVGRIAEHVHGFVRDLHDRGLAVPAPKHRDFLQAIECMRPRTRGSLYWIGRATLTTSHRDAEIFDPTFELWFGSAESVDVVGAVPEESDDEEPTGGGDGGADDE
ncbi:MAG: hypothetical protein ACRDP4_09270, partial [Nocardioidaceae bacterium]